MGNGEGQKLLEDVGPGVSMESLAAGRATLQGYLETCSSQAGLVATGTLDKRARHALRCAAFALLHSLEGFSLILQSQEVASALQV